MYNNQLLCKCASVSQEATFQLLFLWPDDMTIQLLTQLMCGVYVIIHIHTIKQLIGATACIQDYSDVIQLSCWEE